MDRFFVVFRVFCVLESAFQTPDSSYNFSSLLSNQERKCANFFPHIALTAIIKIIKARKPLETKKFVSTKTHLGSKFSKTSVVFFARQGL